MKHKVLIPIYIICIINIFTSIATILTTESNINIIFTGITGFISLVIILGLWDRNEIARKMAIYYFGLQILLSFIGLIISVTLIFQGQYLNGLLAACLISALITAFIFIIRGLNDPVLLQEFHLTNSST